MKDKPNKYKSVSSVIEKKICCGCGACAVICPTSCIEIVFGSRFNFPAIDKHKCIECGQCLRVCPSTFLFKDTIPRSVDVPAKTSFDCYLIHSKDDTVRLDASSGGFITGMILHLMDKGLVKGGIVARCEGKGEDALVAQSFIATDRESLLSARASKYAPVSSCVVLSEVMKCQGKYVFVGTPCMIEGLTKLQALFPKF